MEDKGRETITTFDTLLTTNHIQMMKVFLSYLAPEQQGGLAVFIKFSELQYALQLMQRSPRQPIIRSHRTILSAQSLFDGSLLRGDNSGILELLEELMPFGGPEERARLRSVRNLLTSMSRMREMMEMMEMMKELFPEGMGSGEDGGFGNFANMFSDMSGMGNMTGMSGMADTASGMSGMADMFSGMSGMDPSVILQMLQMFQSAQSDDSHKESKAE